jgi:hypothetical protein
LEYGLTKSLTILGWRVKNIIRKKKLPKWRKLYGIFDWIRYRINKQSNVLYAFYDLQVSPATFDIIPFLVLADQERINCSCDYLHVVIVPGPEDGFREGTVEAYRHNGFENIGADYLESRLRNILVPCCWLIPSCKQITISGSRFEAHALQVSMVKFVFPKGTTVRFPERYYSLKHLTQSMKVSPLPSIQATPMAIKYVGDWIKSKSRGRKVISVTLREASYHPERNSSLKDWSDFLNSLDKNKYFPVVLRDIEKVFDPIPPEFAGITMFNEAVYNVELRAATYELSYLNMCVNNGISMILEMNKKTRYIYIKVVTPTVSTCTKEWFQSMGITPGESLPWASSFQKYVWEDDKYEIITREFDEMCEKIEKGRAS